MIHQCGILKRKEGKKEEESSHFLLCHMMATVSRDRQRGLQNLGKCPMDFALSTVILSFVPSASFTESQKNVLYLLVSAFLLLLLALKPTL